MSEAELISRIDALEAQLAELRQVSEDAYDVGCEYPGEGTEYSIEIPTQQVFGGGGVAQKETPYAWRVRAVTPPEVDPETPEEERPSGFQVFAPYAVISQATLPTVPDGFSASATWQDIKAAILPDSSSGAWTLYAILKYTPEIQASGSGSSATEAKPAKTEFTLSSAFPDTSSDPAGTRYRIFNIASRAADGTLTQIQAGPIVETFPPAQTGGGLCAGPLTYDRESGHVVQYLGTFGAGGTFTQAKGASGQPIIATDYGAAIKALNMGATEDTAYSVFASTGFLPLNWQGIGMIMSKQTVNGLTLDLNYKAPQYEDDVGALQARTGVSVTYWGYQPTTGSTTTLLQTITEPANEKTIYEDGSSQA